MAGAAARGDAARAPRLRGRRQVAPARVVRAAQQGRLLGHGGRLARPAVLAAPDGHALPPKLEVCKALAAPPQHGRPARRRLLVLLLQQPAEGASQLLPLLLLRRRQLLLVSCVLHRLLRGEAAHGCRDAALQQVHRQRAAAALLLLLLLLLHRRLHLLLQQRVLLRLLRLRLPPVHRRPPLLLRRPVPGPWLPTDDLPALAAQVVAALVACAAAHLRAGVEAWVGSAGGVA